MEINHPAIKGYPHDELENPMFDDFFAPRKTRDDSPDMGHWVVAVVALVLVP